jgi:protein-S-isoprenylcysteine O-methyltransferase Ste14
MDLVGRSPVPLPIFVISKISLLGCAFFFLVKLLRIDTMLYESSATNVIGILLYCAGLIIIVTSLAQLGASASVGLPERVTELRRTGLYRLSRNPMYLGGFVLCLGSCLFSIHPVNILMFMITGAVHVRIVMKEEEFLESRFGAGWLEYKLRVPRFFGIPGRGKSQMDIPEAPKH